MPGLIFTRADVIALKNDPDYPEKWVRDRLAEDPSLLGLGPLLLRDVEHTQPRAGRLDLLFSDPLDHKRFEVELMLGPMDESHVIRAIEYWDSERRRTPQYDHCAVLVAEQISGRFMNVLGLFSPFIPIIAVQMIALRVNEYLTLQFYRVHGDNRVDRPERSGERAVPDAVIWSERSGGERRWNERRGKEVETPSLATPNLAPALLDECLNILRSIDPAIVLDHRRDTVALSRGERRTECISFFPHRNFLGVKARANNKQEWLTRLESAGIVVLSGGPLRKRIHFRLTLEQAREQRELLRDLFATCLREQGFAT
jgi:hypothetical protein